MTEEELAPYVEDAEWSHDMAASTSSDIPRVLSSQRTPPCPSGLPRFLSVTKDRYMYHNQLRATAASSWRAHRMLVQRKRSPDVRRPDWDMWRDAAAKCYRGPTCTNLAM